MRLQWMGMRSPAWWQMAWMVPVVLAMPAVIAGATRDVSSDSPAYADPGFVADTTITIRTFATNLSFEPDRISVKAGTNVRIRYVNESTLAHNFVIVRSDDDIDTLGMAAHSASETGFVPMQHKDRMIAYSPLAAPGKTVEIMFVAPPAGEYPFACLVDGHYNVMVGMLRSRP